MVFDNINFERLFTNRIAKNLNKKGSQNSKVWKCCLGPLRGCGHNQTLIQIWRINLNMNCELWSTVKLLQTHQFDWKNYVWSLEHPVFHKHGMVKFFLFLGEAFLKNSQLWYNLVNKMCCISLLLNFWA